MLFPKKTDKPEPKPNHIRRVVKGQSGHPVNRYYATLFEANELLPEEAKMTDSQMSFKVENEYWDTLYPEGPPSKTLREHTLNSISSRLKANRYNYNQGKLYKGQPKPERKSCAYNEHGLPIRHGTVSSLEAKFLEGWASYAYMGFPLPTREYEFIPDRKFRLDFAWIPVKVGVEIQGGTWSAAKGGHTSGSGLNRAYEKMNEGQRLGWVILQLDAKYLSTAKIETTIRYVCDVLTEIGKRIV